MCCSLGTIQIDSRNVREVSPSRLFIDGTRIHLVLVLRHFVSLLNSMYINHSHCVEQHLHFRLDQSQVALVPTSALEEQPVDKDAVFRRVLDVLLVASRSSVAEHYGVQGPSLVLTRHLLTHGSEEALWVEESCHPEDRWTAIAEPIAKLRVAVDQLREPKPEAV